MRRTITRLVSALVAAVGRLDKSLNPQDTITKLRHHQFEWRDSIYIVHLLLAAFWLTLMTEPGFPWKLLIPALFTLALLIPFTSQFFFPAIPVFAWVITWYSQRFIPESWRPTPTVSLLPTLESVLYGANISDILTRYTHPVLDVMAWLPYGVLHFVLPFALAIFIWLFRPNAVLHYWGFAFGYMNLIGVWVQVIFPCAAPWYELIYGLTPANYSISGAAGGLARIDAIFGTNAYKNTFGVSPLVFGAFPSLHAGCATMEVLFVSHFWPELRFYAWGYGALLYWATMYLSHHYLIDVVGGACLSVAVFYMTLPEDLKNFGVVKKSKYEIYDLEAPQRRGRGRNGRGLSISMETDISDVSSDPDEQDIAASYRSPIPDNAPKSAVPLLSSNKKDGRGHKHTASIASLIRAEDRVDEGWSPIGSAFAMHAQRPTSRAEIDNSRTS